MPEEGFLRRWARVKATGAAPGEEAAAEKEAAAPAPESAPAPLSAPAPASAAGPEPDAPRWAKAGDTPATPFRADAWASAQAEPAAAGGRAAPTLEDVARLTLDSDYSIFVSQGVDKSVQRLALKKLFADPHFNVMDRLDMYMDDYNIPSPVSEAMLAQLDHARSALRRFVDEEETPAETEARQRTEQEAQSHNEAAQAETLAADDACQAPTHQHDHEHGPLHSPNQQLPQGQA